MSQKDGGIRDRNKRMDGSEIEKQTKREVHDRATDE